jgi:hypothetical protein
MIAAALVLAVTRVTVGAAQVYDTTPHQSRTSPPPVAGSQAGDGSAHQGVISPPPTGDAAINKGAPPADKFPTPVIPPPGTPGGDPKVVPK